MKNDRQIHFPDLRQKPLELFVSSGGSPAYRFKSFCGFENRDCTGDFTKVTCLLCFRSIIAHIRRAASAFGSNNPNLLNPSLFAEISKKTKLNRGAK